MDEIVQHCMILQYHHDNLIVSHFSVYTKQVARYFAFSFCMFEPTTKYTQIRLFINRLEHYGTNIQRKNNFFFGKR